MPAPFKESKTIADVKRIANEIVSAINAKAAEWDGNGLLNIDLSISLFGVGVRPFGDYGKGAYRHWGVKFGNLVWDELSPANMRELARLLTDNVKGFEVTNTDCTSSFYEFASADFSFPYRYCKFGNGCEEFVKLQKLVTKKYGIDLKPQDLYLVRMSGTIRNREVSDRTYIAYAPWRCNELIEKIKSFGRKHTTCKIVTIDDFEIAWMDNERAVWLDIQPKVKK